MKMGYIVYMPVHLCRVAGSLSRCFRLPARSPQYIATHFLPHFPEHNSVQIKQGKQVQQDITTHYMPTHPHLLKPSSSAPPAPQTPKATDQLQPVCQPPSTHRLHRGFFYTEPLFQDRERGILSNSYKQT